MGYLDCGQYIMFPYEDEILLPRNEQHNSALSTPCNVFSKLFNCFDTIEVSADLLTYIK